MLRSLKHPCIFRQHMVGNNCCYRFRLVGMAYICSWYTHKDASTRQSIRAVRLADQKIENIGLARELAISYPAGHGSPIIQSPLAGPHAVDPAAAEYLPSSQSLHPSLPVTALYLPDTQSTHSSPSGPDEPALQTHVVADGGELECAGHASHADAPTAA